MSRHSVFVPDDSAGTRHETAVLLVGTAREFEIHQRDIKSAPGGFWITEVLADVLYAETEEEVEPEPEIIPEPTKPAKKTTAKKSSAKAASTNSTTETSGDRAVENNSTTEQE